MSKRRRGRQRKPKKRKRRKQSKVPLRKVPKRGPATQCSAIQLAKKRQNSLK